MQFFVNISPGAIAWKVDVWYSFSKGSDFVEETAYLSPDARAALIRAYLGRTVEVVIDRPIGYVHHVKGITLHYTVNYGYLPGVLGGDREEQDVYVLGVQEPLERFTGRIIGAIRRRDDTEDKLVAAPEGVLLHQAQIAEAVHFVEQYFDSTVDSLLRKSCGVIPFRKDGESIRYLMVKQSNGVWSFPKGHMERGESEIQTALRETREEAGLEPVLVPGFRETVEYDTRMQTHKQVVLFLGEVRGEPRVDNREIRAFRWVTAEEAKQEMMQEQRPVLDRAQAYLEGQNAENLHLQL